MSSIRDCRSLLPLLSSFADGELPAEEQWAVEKHIATCAVCAKVVSDFSATSRLVGSLPVGEPSVGFDAALAARLADISLGSRRPKWSDRLRRAWDGRPLRPVWAPLAAAAAIPLVAFAVVRSIPKSEPVAAAPSENHSLDAIVGDHVRAASLEPLGGTSSLMLASAPASATETGGF